MYIHQLTRKNPHKKEKTVGRGGKRGKTSGRGHKGQRQHGGHGIRPQIRDIIKKLPKQRGRGRNSNKSVQAKVFAVNVGVLEVAFNSGDAVNLSSLRAHKLVSGAAGFVPVKILGTGTLTKKLSVVGLTVSATAREKIVSSGGSVA